MRHRETETESERQRQTETERDRERDRQRQTDRETDRDRDRKRLINEQTSLAHTPNKEDDNGKLGCNRWIQKKHKEEHEKCTGNYKRAP